jgi:hypothetical protein
MVGAQLKVKKQDNTASMLQRVSSLEKQEVYVGVTQPKSTRQEAKHSLTLPGGIKAKAVDTSAINNAQLAFIHTNGSPLKGIPPRPIIQPAIQAPGNKEPIMAELCQAAQATLQGATAQAANHLKRAGMTAQNAVRAWFTDARNGWAPNRPSTIKAKGSDRPLIDTAQLRKAMTYVVKEK